MKTIEEIMYHLAGHGIIVALADTLREHDPEFAEAERNYHSAIEVLRNELPADMAPTLDEYIQAHENDIVSLVSYAGYLGYRVNVDNFHHPVMIDFVHLDTIDYIKEHLFGHFPVNYKASKTYDAFYKAMPSQLDFLHDAVASYFTFMECAGPKLAHYAGYVIANKLLPWVEPGYREDWSQTQAFEREVQKYFGYTPL